MHVKLSVPLFDVILNISRNILNFDSQYMIILLLVFIVQFSVSCACLALNQEQQVSKVFFFFFLAALLYHIVWEKEGGGRNDWNIK